MSTSRAVEIMRFLAGTPPSGMKRPTAEETDEAIHLAIRAMELEGEALNNAPPTLDMQALRSRYLLEKAKKLMGGEPVLDNSDPGDEA